MASDDLARAAVDDLREQVAKRQGVVILSHDTAVVLLALLRSGPDQAAASEQPTPEKKPQHWSDTRQTRTTASINLPATPEPPRDAEEARQ